MYNFFSQGNTHYIYIQSVVIIIIINWKIQQTYIDYECERNEKKIKIQQNFPSKQNTHGKHTEKKKLRIKNKTKFVNVNKITFN